MESGRVDDGDGIDSTAKFAVEGDLLAGSKLPLGDWLGEETDRSRSTCGDDFTPVVHICKLP